MIFLQVVINKGREYVSEFAREYEKTNEAGIDIETARKVLQEEDKYDKEIFRQKVKQKHREEKQKQKRESQKQEESEFSDDSDDDDDGPDLSWLPDPDKRLSGSDSESADEENDESEVDESNLLLNKPWVFSLRCILLNKMIEKKQVILKSELQVKWEYRPT